jgi:tetratricopeptide (TPR) repeat protein
MGGVGKTQLTLEYCIRMKNLGTFRAIFWLDASSRNSLYRSMEIIAKRFLPGRVFDNPDDAVTSVKEILSSWSDAWLMVVDNFDDPSELQDILQLLPDSQYASILITSRYAGSKELGQSIEVDCMEKSEGLQLLLQSPEHELEELAAADEILARLGYLPLAIDQARAYISRRQLRLRDFLGEFGRRKKNIMKETPRFWHYRRTLPDNEKISLSLLTTWEMSLPLLGAGDNGSLKDVLTLFSFFHPFSISEKIFSSNETNPIHTSPPMSIFHDNGRWDHLKFEDAVLQMQELSLLRFSHRGANEIVVSLHSMVSEWLRMRLDENSRSRLLSTAISYLHGYLDTIKTDDYAIRQETISHLDTICQTAEFDTKSSSSGACHAFGLFYYDQGRFEDAERMYNRALSGYEKTLGPDHNSTLDIINNLGLLYSDQGRLDDAEKAYNRALAGLEKALGSDHLSTLNTVNNLGILYKNQGRLDDAERMYSRALARMENALGPDHKSTLEIVGNLGNLYKMQGLLEDAERLYNRALSSFEKALGSDHTSTLNAVGNLGVLYCHQGRLNDAERMYSRALSGFEKALGPEHPSTLSAVNNLGILYYKQRSLEDAETMYSRALAGYEKALGLDHVFTLNTANNLGLLCFHLDRLEDSERLYNRALVGKEKALGPGHPSTLDTVFNLGRLHSYQNRLEDAERMFDRALSGYRKALGPEHPSTLDVVFNLGRLYSDQGRVEDAERMFDRALSGYETALGPDHRPTLDTVSNLGRIYSDQGRLEDAERMFDRALSGYRKVLDPEHPTILDTINNLACIYKVQGRLEEAERLYNCGMEKALGPENPSTLDTVSN